MVGSGGSAVLGADALLLRPCCLCCAVLSLPPPHTHTCTAPPVCVQVKAVYMPLKDPAWR